MNSLISIIIPTYNSQKYFKECLDSIVNQIYKNIEVIIVDGSSTDKTQEIANYYCNKYDNWKLIVTKKGVSHQRNKGLENFKGQYLYFLDSDDKISSNLIKDLFEKMISNNLDLITPSICSEYYDNNNLIKSEILIPKIHNNVNENNFFENGYDSFLAGPTKLYKRELVKNVRFDEEISYGEDLFFNYQIVRNCPIKYGVCDAAIYFYRHNISITNPLSKRMNKSGYLYCVKMVDILKTIKNNTKNFDDALSLLKTNLLLYIDEFLARKKIIPFILLKPRLYMFKQTKRKFRYYYLFPRTFILLSKILKIRKKQ